MGVLDVVTGPVSQHFYQLSTASQIGVLFAGFLFLSVVVNVAQQLLFKNPNEPPVVFHLFPIIGSTITYGMDPPRFFVENRNKVSLFQSPPLPPPLNITYILTRQRVVWQCLYLHPPWQEDHRLRRPRGQRVHLERQG